MGTCPEIQPHIAVLISAYATSFDEQGAIQQALGRAARATLAQQKAQSLSETLGSNLDEMIKQQVLLHN